MRKTAARFKKEGAHTFMQKMQIKYAKNEEKSAFFQDFAP